MMFEYIRRYRNNLYPELSFLKSDKYDLDLEEFLSNQYVLVQELEERISELEEKLSGNSNGEVESNPDDEKLRQEVLDDVDLDDFLF